MVTYIVPLIIGAIINFSPTVVSIFLSCHNKELVIMANILSFVLLIISEFVNSRLLDFAIKIGILGIFVWSMITAFM